MAVVDLLEMIDVAEGDAQRFNRRLRFVIVPFQKCLECAAVGQAGEVIDLGIVPGAL
jgi:hypothetical protein